MSGGYEEVSRVVLVSYLNEALPADQMAQIEERLRVSPEWQAALRDLFRDQDFGDHSVATIWQRHRLTCISRDRLIAFEQQVLHPAEMDYIRFHLEVVGCRFCQANLADLRLAMSGQPVQNDATRRYYDGSVRHLPPGTRR